MERLENEFSWSRSRASIFRECPRRYWFQYYGSWGGWEAASPPRVRQAYVLKQLKSRWMWVGEVVHWAIERILTSARIHQPMEEAKAVEWALDRMRGDFRASRDRKYRERPKKVVGLFEHEYEVPTTDDQWREAADHMRACIGTFYRSPYHAFLPKLPRGHWLPIEELDHFFLDGVKVFVKPDAAFRSGARTVEIVDWKTGRRDDEPDPIQLACYSVYALEKKWAERAEDVTTTEYNLATGKAREAQVTEERLVQVKADIRASVAEMRQRLDDAGKNVAREEKFAVTTDARACRACGFRKICPESPLKDPVLTAPGTAGEPGP